MLHLNKLEMLPKYVRNVTSQCKRTGQKCNLNTSESLGKAHLIFFFFFTSTFKC